MTETSNRKTCTVCGKNVQVRVDGLLRNHYPASGGRMWCDGGGDRSATPAEADRKEGS